MDECPQHAGQKPQRKGQRAKKDGTQVARYWCAADGGHSLSETVPGTGPAPAAAPRRRTRTRKTATATVRCPKPHHADAKVTKYGTYETDAGRWQRYLCNRPNGQGHTFALLTAANGSALLSITTPPTCPDHPNSHVVRDGKHRRSQKQVKSKSIPSVRQRYLCTPEDDSPAHRFVATLGREVVDVGSDACADCEELLSPHRGTQAVSRRSRHPLKAVVACLSDLSSGVSYAQASNDLRARTQHAIEHRRTHHRWLDELGTEGELELPDYATASGSAAGTKSKNGWRLAADLTEQYAPVLWGHASERIAAREAAQRASNDRVLAANPGAVLANPIVWVLDELPVITHRSRGKATRYEQTRWHMLVVTEIRWQHTKRVAGENHDAPPMREAKLRLARAYPGASTHAWRLVLAELGVRPDFVISDFSAAINKALTEHYPPGTVGHVPSFFHMARNIRTALTDKPGATEERSSGTELVEELEKSMDGLTRADLVAGGRQGWTWWWDEFLDRLARHGVPLGGFAEQRRIYEKPVADAFTLLAANPHLPASNAAVETKIRLKLEPLLVGRKQRYRNLARTNRLLDLAVCREQGMFLDTDAVAGLIRDYNNTADGWAPKGREVCDVHPAKSGTTTPAANLYSSLLDPFITDALFTSKVASA